MKYRLYLYDLWGNEQDGYYVNDTFSTSAVKQLADPWDIEEIKDKFGLEHIMFDDAVISDGDVIYLLDDESEQFKPVAELRAEPN